MRLSSAVARLRSCCSTLAVVEAPRRYFFSSASSAWAVGWYQTSGGTDRTLMLHWNGTSWTRS